MNTLLIIALSKKLLLALLSTIAVIVNSSLVTSSAGVKTFAIGHVNGNYNQLKQTLANLNVINDTDMTWKCNHCTVITMGNTLKPIQDLQDMKDNDNTVLFLSQLRDIAELHGGQVVNIMGQNELEIISSLFIDSSSSSPTNMILSSSPQSFYSASSSNSQSRMYNIWFEELKLVHVDNDVLYSFGLVTWDFLMKNDDLINKPVGEFSVMNRVNSKWIFPKDLMDPASSPIFPSWYRSRRWFEKDVIHLVMAILDIERMIISTPFSSSPSPLLTDSSRESSVVLCGGEVLVVPSKPDHVLQVQTASYVFYRKQSTISPIVFQGDLIIRLPAAPTTPILVKEKNNWSQLYVFGDLHGDVMAFLVNLKAVGLISVGDVYIQQLSDGNFDVKQFDSVKWTGENSLLVIVGDILDRGPGDLLIWRILKHLHHEAQKSGGQVEPLLGNHEIMNLMGRFYYVNSAYHSDQQALYDRQQELSMDSELGKFIRTRKAILQIDNTVFSHAGLLADYASLGIDFINYAVTECLTSSVEPNSPCFDSVLFSDSGPFWTRTFSGNHYHSLPSNVPLGFITTISQTCELAEESLRMLKAERMIVGHTVQKSQRISALCEGHLIRVDVGLSSWMTRSSPESVPISAKVIAALRIDSKGRAWAMYRDSTHLIPMRHY